MPQRRVLVAVVCSLVTALSHAEGQSGSSVPELISQLRSSNPVTRRDAARALRALGPAAAAAVPALEAALRDENATVRSQAAFTLGAVGPEASPAVPALALALSDDVGKVRGAAAEALRVLGAKARPAVPALVAALSDEENSDVALWALESIGEDCKAQGQFVWWVVPRVFWWEALLALAGLVVWFSVARALVTRHRPRSNLLWVAATFVTASPAAAGACSAVYYATTRKWAQGFLPEPVLAVSPLPVAVTLSTAFLCVLAAVWACSNTRPDSGTDTPELDR